MTKAPSIKYALERARWQLDRIVGEYPVNHGSRFCVNVATAGIREIDEALATLQPDGERRDAIARLVERLKSRIGSGRTVTVSPGLYEDISEAAVLLASGLVQDEAGWREISTAPKDGTRFLWSCGDDKMSVIHWPEYDLCFEGGYWMPLPAPPIRSARDGGAES